MRTWSYWLAAPDCCAAGKLLAKEPELKADFSRAQGAGSNAKANKVARFLPNPEANWGPRPKHGRPVKVCTCVSYTNQSLGLGSALPGQALWLSLLYCSQSVSAVIIAQGLWLCFQPRWNPLSVAMRLCPVNVSCDASGCAVDFVGSVRKALNSALSCLLACCTAETG